MAQMELALRVQPVLNTPAMAGVEVAGVVVVMAEQDKLMSQVADKPAVAVTI